MWRLLAPGLLALGAVTVAVGQPQGQERVRPQQQSKQKPATAGAAPESNAPTWIQEADRVVAEAEERAREEEAARQRVAEHFLLCDLNANGWISFREGLVTLGLEKAQFRNYDKNSDGRIDAAEFAERDEALLTLLGAVPMPRPPAEDSSAPELSGTEGVAGQLDPGSKRDLSLGAEAVGAAKARFPDPRKLLEGHDADQSQGLSLAEVTRLFEELELPFSADVILGQMDPDDSGELEAHEVGPLALLLAKRIPAESVSDVLELDPAVLEEIYLGGKAGKGRGRARKITRLAGPTPHFRRLDPTNDGYIDVNDLRDLLAPARVSVRASAIISALDQDGDGRLSEPEFLGALSDRGTHKR